MKRRRVKITGIGPVTPAGIGREEFWKGILEPVSRVRAYGDVGEAFGPFVATQVKDFDIENFIDRSVLPKGVARHSQFAVAGAVLALADAGIGNAELRSKSAAVVTGSAIMDFAGIINSMDRVRLKGVRAAQAKILPAIGIGSAASAVSKVLGITGYIAGISNQCVSGLEAIGYAAKLIADGEADIAICGGTDAPLHHFPLVELRAAGLTPATTQMPERQARPFDLWRTTGVVGEGCCMLVLEAEDSPRLGYAYIAGYASSNDSGGALCSGMITAAKLAMAQAGVRPGLIDVINAWAPGHKLLDRAEAFSMKVIFEEKVSQIATLSIKGAIGMPFAGASAMQVAVAALGQKSGMIAPTVNWQYPDPDCGLNLSGRARAIHHQYTMLNSHGFGGVNGVMIVGQC